MYTCLSISVRADTGGGPEHLYRLLLHQPDWISICVACPDDRPYFERYKEIVGASSVVQIPHRSFTLGAFFRLVRFVKSNRISVIHSHGKGAGIYSRLLGLLTGTPVVHTFHGLHVGDYGKLAKQIYLGIERLLSVGTSRAICVSHGEQNEIIGVKIIHDEKLSVIPNGVDVPTHISRPKLQSAPLSIVAVSRFDFQKNTEKLIEIAALLKGKIDFRLTILGDGEGKSSIQCSIQNHGLSEQVFLKGSVPNPRDYYKQAHVFCSTSRWEGMPLAVLEAMSEGLCVIATDVVGNRDVIIDGHDGLLFNSDEQAVQLLTDRTQAEFIEIGLRAHEKIKVDFTIEDSAARTYECIKAAIEPN